MVILVPVAAGLLLQLAEDSGMEATCCLNSIVEVVRNILPADGADVWFRQSAEGDCHAKRRNVHKGDSVTGLTPRQPRRVASCCPELSAFDDRSAQVVAAIRLP